MPFTYHRGNPIGPRTTVDLAEMSDIPAVVSPLFTRLIIPGGQTINNVGAPWNDIDFANMAIVFDEIGGSVVGGEYVVPGDGIYKITTILNTFDNNSARAAHRERYLIDGFVFSGYDNMEGHNHMRGSGNHDSACNIYPDIYRLLAGNSIRLQAQTNSSLLNTTDVTGGWAIIERVT